MLSAKELDAHREGGERDLFRVKFPTIYGFKSQGFTCRTLRRGEIFKAFCKFGYPEREIPKDKAYDRCRVENELFPQCVIDVPDDFQMHLAHALIVTTVVNEALRRSGFIDGTAEQIECLKYGLKYANSIEGRTDAMILHYFPSIRTYDLEQMTYKQWSMRSMQAVLLAKSVDGKDLFGFMTPDTDVMRVFEPATEEPEQAAAPPPAQQPKVKAKPGKPTDPKAARTEAQKAELLRQLGMAPKLTPQAIGLNPNASIERGETRMFVAGEKYDVDKLKPKINQDAQP